MGGEGRTRVLAWCAALGAVIGIGAWFLGVAWPFALAGGVFVVALGGAWVGVADSDRPLYVRRAVEPRPGTRSEVSQTAWALRGRGREVGDAGRKRLRAFAQSRLRRQGMDLDAPADAARIAELITPRALAALDSHARIGIADVEYCLDRLEQIASPPAPQPRGPQ